MTATISELPLRPRPQAGEALLGYLLRIVNTNGYDSIQTFRKLFGLKSTLLHNLSIVSPNIDEVLRHLSGRVNIKVDVLKAHFDKEYDFSTTRTVRCKTSNFMNPTCVLHVSKKIGP